MKLLILTQKVDKYDDILGFFHSWVDEFAKHCEKVTVIALGVGEYDLPQNVKIFSLGKEKNFRDEVRPRGGAKRRERSFLEEKIFFKLIYIFNFYKYIWQERKNYDSVFVHMNPEYIVLGGLIWRLLGKKIGLWYMHKSVDFKLRIAEKLTHFIFSGTSESFRLKTKKLHITGHGIDIDRFRPVDEKIKNDFFQIISVGRISPIKNQDVLIKAIKILKDNHPEFKFKVDLIGGADSFTQREYKLFLETLIQTNYLENEINFISSLPNREMNKIYVEADLSVNLCPTGGADKAVLESMACELPVLVFNKTFADFLPENLMLNELEPKLLAGKIYWLSQLENRNFNLRGVVERNHNLKKLIPNILNTYYA